MKDDRSDYAPTEAPTGEAHDTDMGVMAGILEAETPVSRLFKFSEEEYETAVEAKSHRKSNEDAVKSLLKEEHLCEIVQKLPEEGVNIMVEEIAGMFKEAEPLGLIAERHTKAVVEEINTVVSEIYSPPRATEAAEILAELNIDPGVVLDLTTYDELGNPW